MSYLKASSAEVKLLKPVLKKLQISLPEQNNDDGLCLETLSLKSHFDHRGIRFQIDLELDEQGLQITVD